MAKKKLEKSTPTIENLIARAYEKGFLEHSGDAAEANGGTEFGYWCSAEQLRDLLNFVTQKP